MKTKSTFCKPGRNRNFPLFSFISRCMVLALLLVGGIAQEGYAQTKEYATWTPNSGYENVALGALSGGDVVNPGNAALANEDFAVLNSHRAVLGISGRDGWIQLKFDKAISPKEKVYVKLSEIGQVGLSLPLGSILGAPDNFLKTTFYRNATSGSNSNNRGSELKVSIQSEFIKDASGGLYLMIQSLDNTEEFNSIEVRLTFPGGLDLDVIARRSVRVHYAFTLNSTFCDPAQFTDEGRTTGISLNLGDVVKNPEFAIDENTSNYSEISTGTLAVLGSASQSFYFSALSEENSLLKVRLQLSSAVADVNILGGYYIRAYNGSNPTPVLNYNIQSGLINGLNLLGILGSGGVVTIPVNVADPFDRVEVVSATTLNVSIGADLRIYGVSRTSAACPEPPPTPSPLLDPQCFSDMVNSSHTDEPGNAVDDNFDSYATIHSDAGIIAGIAGYSGHLTLGMGAEVPVGKTTYIRIDYDTEVLNALLAGSLGNTVIGLANGLLLGQHHFTVDVINSTNTGQSYQGSSANNFSTTNGKIRIVQDKLGLYYIAIKSDVVFDQIRITDHNTAVVGLTASQKSINVYGACYENSENICDPAFSTFYEGSGINLDLLNLGSNGVTNAQYAIDGNLNTASKISVGAVGIAASMYQHIQFNTLSKAEDHFRIKFKMPQGVVSADVLGGIIVKAFNGSELVFEQRLSEGLIPNLDLLDLLSTNQLVNLPFSPGRPFDRVAFGLESLVSLNVAINPIELYSVERFSADCIDPELSWDPATTPPFNKEDCGTTVEDFLNVNFAQEAVTNNPSFDTYATMYAGSGAALGLGAFSSHLDLKYTSEIPAHEMSYIRVDTEDGLFKALLGGSLGEDLGALLGSVALGNQYLVIEVKDKNGVIIGSPISSVAGWNSDFVKLVKDKDGKFYLAVTASSDYQSVRINYHNTALVGGATSTNIKVYGMCRETVFDPCEQATFTSWDGKGIALDILDLTKGGVANPEFAIDDNSSNYSTLNLGLIGAAASVSQNIYFKTKSLTADQLRVRLQLDQPSILSVDIFGSSSVILYNGEEKVFDQPLKSGLINNLDLLALFNSGGAQTFTFSPGLVYDRVEIKISSLLEVGTSAPVRLYGVTRVSANCPDPDIVLPTDIFEAPVCAEDVVLESVKAVDDVAYAIDGDYNTYATMRADAGIIFGLANSPSVLELAFENATLANTTSYLRIGDDAGILDALLSGSIGETVYQLVNGLVLGNNYFVIRAKGTNNEVLEGSSKNNFAAANGLIKIVQDNAGRYYVAISPEFNYKSVEIKAFSESALGLLAEGYNLHVYGMCYETDFDGCPKPFSTSWDGDGLNLGLSGAAAVGVVDAFKALDNNNNGDFSTLSTGVLSLGGYIQQNIQFNKEIPANSPFKIKMEVGAGVVNASVFGNVFIVGYKNGEEVYNKAVENAILGNVTIAQVFSNGGAHEVDFAIDEAVDEIALRLNSLVDITVVPDVRLYYIVQDCDFVAPEFVAWKSADQTIVKGGEEVEYTIHIRNTGTVDISGLAIEDIIPANTTYVPTSGGAYDTGTNTVTFENINVPIIGGDVVLSFKVKVVENLTGVTEITNVALVKTNPTDPGRETLPPSPTDPAEPDTDPIAPGTVIEVEHTSDIVTWKGYAVSGGNSATSVSGGEEVTYTIYIQNKGNQDLSGLSVLDKLPKGTIYKDGSGGSLNGANVEFAGINVPFGETESVSFTVTVNEDLTDIDDISNVAVVKVGNDETETVPPADPANPIDGPNTAETPGTSTDIPVIAVHSVEFTKSGINQLGIKKATVGDIITYTLTVVNKGNKDLVSVTLKDLLSTEVNLIEVNGVTFNGGDIDESIPVLKVGETNKEVLTFKVEVQDLPGIPNPLVNTATATFEDIDGALETKTAIESLPTFCDVVTAENINLTNNMTICAGGQVTLIASFSPTAVAIQPTGSDFVWRRGSITGPIVHEGATYEPTLLETTTYVVSLEGGGACFEAPAKEVTITVNPLPATPTIIVNGNLNACEGEGLLLESPSATGNRWFKDNILIVDENGDAIDQKQLPLSKYSEAGIYTLQVIDAVTGCESLISQPVEVTINQTPTILFDGKTNITLAGNVNTPVVIPGYTVDPVGSTVTWYDENGNPIGNNTPTPTFASQGIYAYTVVVESAANTCSNTATVVFRIFDADNCPPVMERIYATTTTPFIAGIGGVANLENAVDKNPTKHSTITVAVPLLGTGAGQVLTFDQLQPKGTPVTIKLAKEYSGLVVAGGLSVVGLDASGKMIGAIKIVDGDLVNLLGGDNVFEYTFVPSNKNGPQAYKSVRVYASALLGVAMQYRVYNAYTHKFDGSVSCEAVDPNVNSDVLDVFHGVKTIGVNLASAVSSVYNPWRAVDGDLTSFASISRVLGVLNGGFITPVFKSSLMPTDEVQIILDREQGGLLNLGLLSSFSIQRYYGDQKVGGRIAINDGVLGLKLINIGNDKSAIVIAPHAEPYDRVELFFGGVLDLNLSDVIRIYDISVKPKINTGIEEDDIVELCPDELIILGEPEDNCTYYDIFDAKEGGESLELYGKGFKIPADLATGTYTYYVQATRYGCKVGERIAIQVRVKPVPVIENIVMNGVVTDETTLAPGETLEAIPTIENVATVKSFKWELETDQGEWIQAIVGDVINDVRGFRLKIPASGILTIDGVDVDVREKALNLRLELISTESCIVISEPITLNISKSKYDFGNDNVTKEAADGVDAIAVAGKEFTYIATIINGGPSTINEGTTLYLQDVLSDGQTIESITGSDNISVITDGTEFFTVIAEDDIKEGKSFTLTITANVDPAIVVDIVSNSIKIWTEDPAGDTNVLEDGIATTPPYPVDREYGFNEPGAVLKAATAGSNATATAGSSFEYTVTLINKGSSTILGGTTLFLQDLASEGQTITGITSDNGTATILPGAESEYTFITNTSVTTGESIELKVTVDVAADIVADEVNNTINVWSKDPVGVYDDPEGTDTTPDYEVDRDYGFGDKDAVVKIATDGVGATATAGEAFEYTVTLTNKGISTIKGGTTLFLQDLASEGQIITGIVSDNGAVTKPDADGAFTLLTDNPVAKEESIVLTVTVDVASDIVADVINNTINIWSKNPAGDYDTPEGKANTPDYKVLRDYGWNDPEAVVKVGDAATATAGEAYSYTVTLTNKGTSTIMPNTTLYLQDVVSAGQSFNGITSNNGTASTVATDGTFTLDVAAAVAPNEIITLTVNVNVASDIVADFINNTINIWSEDPTGNFSDPEGTDKTGDIPVERDYGWNDPEAVVKAGDAATATAGEAFSYTVTLTNKGASTINAGTVLYLQDIVSAGQTISGITSNGSTVSPVGSDGRFNLTVGSAIAPNSSIVLTVIVALEAGIEADIVNNRIKIWTNDPGTDLENPDGTGKTPDIEVDRVSAFKVVKTTDATKAIAGKSIDFKVVLTNSGPSTAKVGHHVVITEKPAGLTIVGSDIAVTSGNATFDGNYDATSGKFTIVVNSEVDLGETIELNITAHVPENAVVGSTVKNGIEVDGDDDETPEIPVDREYKLSITKVADEATVKAGESTTFTLTITNNGPSEIAVGKVISLSELPGTGVTITGYEVTSGNGTAAGTGNTATVTTSATIAVGGVVTVKVSADIASDAPVTITNGIEVWGPDKPTTETPDDKDETPEIPVIHASNLSIAKVADQKTVVAGEATSFTLTITNNGPSNLAAGKTIRLAELPSAGVTITGYTVTGTNASVKADAGNLNKATVTTSSVVGIGETIIVKVAANVAANAPATISNGIQVWGPDKPETEKPDGEDKTPEIPADRKYTMSITKVADEDRVIAGEATTFTLTVTNNGPSEIAIGKIINLTERPGAGVNITNYEVTSGNAVAAGSGNTAAVTASKAIAKGETITVKVTATIALDAPATITNGISVWGPDKPTTGPEDDKDDTPEIPVGYPGPDSKDDFAETKSFVAVDIDVLANDEATRFAIDASTVRVVNQPMAGMATVNADGTITYVSDRGFTGTDTFVYQVKDVVGNWSNEAMVTATVTENPLFFPNTFTPNGDGLNDAFVVKGLDQYAETEMIILNRWGNQVYSKRNYANDWTGDNLNEGTYYYVLKVRNHSGDWEVHKGHIAIIRSTK